MLAEDDVEELDNNEVSQILASRRQILRLAGFGIGATAVGLGLAACGTSSAASMGGSSATPPPTTSPGSCLKLTAEQIEGPYYIDYELVRSDVREGQAGIPLTLTLSAIDSVTCTPLRNAAIEIWQANAVGVYSGYAASTTDFRAGMPSGMPSGKMTGSPPAGFTPPAGAGGGAGHQTPVNKLTFLRGMQLTNANGAVTFTTIVPGWYPGRAIHIHTKVHVDGTMSSSGYQGGHQAHTGQLYFDEPTTVEIAKVSPYSTNTIQRVLLTEDSIYPGGGATGGLLTLDFIAGKVASGIKANIAMAVETTKTHDGSDAPAMSFGSPTPTATS